MVDHRDGDPKDVAKEIDIDGQFKVLSISREEYGKEHGDGHAREVPEIPEHLIESIIAKLPFPSILKACCPSKGWNRKIFAPSSSVKVKSWYSKFLLPSSSVESSTSSESFQEQIASRSSKWPSYCPTYVSEDGIFTFDKGSCRWRDMSLSYLRAALSMSTSFTCDWSTVTYYGPLMCVTDLSHENFFVTNLVTKCWKKLPCCPDSEQLIRRHRQPDDRGIVSILPVGADGYKVLSTCKRWGSNYKNNQLHTYIYDSKLETWTAKEPRVADVGVLQQGTAYVDGKLYCLGYESSEIGHGHRSWNLWVYDIDENSWTSISLRNCSFADERIPDAALALCGDKVMVITHVNTCLWDGPHLPGGWVHTIEIYEVIPGSLEVKEVRTKPLVKTSVTGWYGEEIECTGDANFLYVGQTHRQAAVWRLNARSYRWRTIPRNGYYRSSVRERVWRDGAFEPGLNPFIMV